MLALLQGGWGKSQALWREEGAQGIAVSAGKKEVRSPFRPMSSLRLLQIRFFQRVQTHEPATFAQQDGAARTTAAYRDPVNAIL